MDNKDDILYNAIGHRVKVKLTNGKTLVGDAHCYETRADSENGECSFAIINDAKGIARGLYESEVESIEILD